jgi:hypothetical protein
MNLLVSRRGAFALAVLAPLVMCSIDPLLAHDRKAAGAITIVLGWASEPAFSGSLNGIVVTLADKAGPLTKADGELAVEVSFGNERITLPLERVATRPGEFHAPLVPTRAGTYAFHVTGRINTQAIDVTSTCGTATFHCVEDNTAIQFPVKDPTVGQLGDRIDRALPRAVAEAGEATAFARTQSSIALAVSVVSLLIGAAAMVMARRTAK